MHVPSDVLTPALHSVPKVRMVGEASKRGARLNVDRLATKRGKAINPR
jgi:hypothetical protein